VHDGSAFAVLLRPDAFGVVQDFLHQALTFQDSVQIREHAPVQSSGSALHAVCEHHPQFRQNATLDAAAGNILWQTVGPTAGAIDTGSVSVANGVMYAGSSIGRAILCIHLVAMREQVRAPQTEIEGPRLTKHQVQTETQDGLPSTRPLI
jgi:hypothetical protein